MAMTARASSGLAYPERFYAAASCAGFHGSSKPVTSRFPNDVALLLYALYQQATIGPCNVSKPRGSSSFGQSKWTSWHRLGSMASTEAMTLFVKILEEEDPGWFSRASDSVLDPVVDVEMNHNSEVEAIVENGISYPETKTISTDNESGMETQDKDVVSEADGSTDAHDQWMSPQLSGQCPKACYEHGAAVIQDKMYFYGEDQNGCYLSDLHMEPVNLDHDGDSISEASLKQLSSLCSAEISGICGDPQMEPRVGNQYQVEIPPLITEAEQLQLLTNPFDSEVMTDTSHMFLIGLPIPIAWVLDEVNGSEDERRGLQCNLSSEANVGYGYSKGGHVIKLKRKSSKLKVEAFTIGLETEQESIQVNLEPKVEQISKSYYPLPGSVGEPWSNADESSFILGLYIFGKSFAQIMKFTEKKEMGEILSFYYGKFYKSDAYRRWSSNRNARSRKCVNGHKIFTGWRQQELISRLLSHVPEESQQNLVEVSKAFAEGKTSLDAYISFLKSTVGIKVLVEAVGIGKGKDDLTSLGIDSLKTKQHFPVCPKIPTGQACSSLTPSDIIKFLTCGYRLSKARCNDIFWEAVWPRLLARGWHSEQPKNRGCATSKNLLVFLIPGVHKFSRRKLVRGIHYFDSVTNVLSKVGSEPELLELETEETRVSCRSEEENIEQGDMSDDQRHRYLKPQVSTCNVNNMKFTVVDTSLACEGKSSKINELRPLPIEYKRTSKNGGNRYEDSEDESDLDVADRPSNGEKKTVIPNHRKGIFNGGLDRMKFTVGGKTPKLGVLRYLPVGLNSQLVSLQRKKFVGSLDKHDQKAANTALNSKKNMVDAGKFDSGAPPLKFTVVDTSVVRGGKFRELRYLPVDLTSELGSLGENLGNSSEDSLDKHDPGTADTMLNCKKRSKIANHWKSMSDGSGSTQNAEVCDSGNGNKMDYLQYQITCDEKQPKASIKYLFSRKTISGNSNSVALPAKRRRLAACVKAETSRSAKICSDGESKALESCEDASNNVLSQAPSSEKLPSASCSAEGPLEGPVIGGYHCMDTSLTAREKPQSQPLIDLNLPQFPQDSKSSDLSMMEVGNRHEYANANANESSNTEELVDGPGALGNTICTGAQEQANMNPRRQSTRNRPLTAKALEALANGFYNVKKRSNRSEDNLFSGLSRSARSRMRVTSHYVSAAGTETVDTEKEKEEEKAVDELHGCNLHFTVKDS